MHNFVFDDGTQEVLQVQTGDSVSLEAVPKVPVLAGNLSVWKDLKKEDLTNILFDRVYTLEHTPMSSTIESDQKASDRPVLLAQGEFYKDAMMTLEMIRVDGAEEGWAIQMPQDATVTALRYLLNSRWEGKTITIMVRRGESDEWETVEHTVSGRYAVIRADETVTGICAVVQTPDYTLEIVVATAVTVLILVSLVILIVRSKKKAKETPALEATEE